MQFSRICIAKFARSLIFYINNKKYYSTYSIFSGPLRTADDLFTRPFPTASKVSSSPGLNFGIRQSTRLLQQYNTPKPSNQSATEQNSKSSPLTPASSSANSNASTPRQSTKKVQNNGDGKIEGFQRKSQNIPFRSQSFRLVFVCFVTILLSCLSVKTNGRNFAKTYVISKN